MQNEKFIKGIEIISSKMPDDKKDDWNIHAEHDQIWFGDEDWITDPLDIKTLDKLGWFTNKGSWSCWA